MSLVTGTPSGNVDTQEDIYLEGSPTIFIQDYSANPLHNPDGDNFYWGMSGTTSYPAYELGCLTAVSMTEDITMNDILCDNVGVKDTVQQRNFLEFTFTVQSFFPLATLRHLMKGATAVTQSAPEEKFGIGSINNNQKWMVYAPKVYDSDVGDYIVFHLHKAKFIDAWSIDMPFGDNWEMTGLKLRAYADTTKPAGQEFGVFLRSDTSVIV